MEVGLVFWFQFWYHILVGGDAFLQLMVWTFKWLCGSLWLYEGELNLFLLVSDDASQMDMFHKDADVDENEEHLDEAEAKWRKERFEREQWLREQVTCGTWFVGHCLDHLSLSALIQAEYMWEKLKSFPLLFLSSYRRKPVLSSTVLL